MSLKVAELLATLGVDASGLDAKIKAETGKAAATVGTEMGRAGETGGQRLTDGLVAGTEEAMSQTARAIREGEAAASKAAGDVGEQAGRKLDSELASATSDLGDNLGDRLKANSGDLDQRAKTIGADSGDRLTDALDTATRDLGDGLDERLKANSTDLSSQAADIGGDTGDALGGGILDGLPDVGGGLEGLMGGALGGLPTAVAGPAGIAGAAVGAALVAGFAEALDRGKINAKLAARLDVDGATAKQFGRVTSEVWADNWGDSTEDVADAIDAVYSTLDDSHRSEAALQRLTTKALSFAQVMDADVAQAVANAGVIVQSGLADNADEAFDLMTASAQRVPAYVRDELADATHEYSTFFASLGYTGEEAFGLLVKAAEGGTYAIDKTGDAIKELSIRATDLADTGAMSALEQIGLVPEDITTRLLAGGKIAREATQEIIDGLLAIEDPAQQAAAATALLGAPIEDLNKAKIPEFLKGLADTDSRLKDVKGSADDLADSGKNLGSAWDTVSRKISNSIAEWTNTAIDPFAQFLIPDSDELDAKWKRVGGASVKAFMQGWEAFGGPFAPGAPIVEELYYHFNPPENPDLGKGLGAALGVEYKKQADAASEAAEKERLLALSQEHQQRSAERAEKATKFFTEQVDGLRLASEKAGDLLGLASLRADGFRKSLDMSSQMDDQLSSALGMSAAYKSFAEVIRDLPHDLDVTAIAFGGLTEKPTKAVQQLLSYGDQVRGFLADTLQFDGEESTRDAAERIRTQLERTGAAAGMSRAQIDELLRVVGVSDEQIEIAIKVSGDDLAITKIQLLKDMIAPAVGANPEFQMFISTAIAKGDFQDVSNLLSAFTEDMADGSIENPILLALGVDTLPATLMTDEWRADTEETPATVPVDADTEPATGKVQHWWDYVSSHPPTATVHADTEPASEEFRRWAEHLATRGVTIPVKLEKEVLGAQSLVDAGGYGTPYQIGIIEYARGTDLNGNGIIGRAAGGPITGVPIEPLAGLPASDTILTAGTPGEWMINAQASAKLGPQAMAMVNAGQLPSAVMPIPVDAGGSGGGSMAIATLADAVAINTSQITTLARAVATRGDEIVVHEARDGYQTAQEIFRAKMVNAHAIVG